MNNLFKFFIVSIFLLNCSLSYGAVYTPDWLNLATPNLDNCNNKDMPQKYFSELQKIYESIDQDLPGVSPEKKAYINDEYMSSNINRRSQIMKDPDFYIIRIIDEISMIYNDLKYINISKKGSISKTRSLFILLDHHLRLKETDFVNLYNFLGSNGRMSNDVKNDGIQIMLSLSLIQSHLLYYGMCLSK